MSSITEKGRYCVVWPRGNRAQEVIACAERLKTLEGKTICELSNQIFRSKEIFPIIERELLRRYANIKFVSCNAFDFVHAKESEVVAELPELLKRNKCDAVISGVGSATSSSLAVVRTSVESEKMRIPSTSIIAEGFISPATLTAAGSGIPNLPIAAYPGHVNVQSADELRRNVEGVLIEQIIKGLTIQPEKVGRSSEPGFRDIVFEGTFEEVNRFFYEKEWSDGLPLVPPTVDKVEEFLKFTERAPDHLIGVLAPDKREATLWNIAVNGVMAGCRPEYMPVLVAIVEAMADPSFGQEHLGHAPGTEALITINGPIIKDLGFNYGRGALRVGFQANTSIGRFWRLYLRNVAGFLPHKTDGAVFGGTWRVVLAEDEDAVAKIGWKSMSVDQGFEAGDNVITISSCTSTDSVFSFGTAIAEEILDKLAARIVDIQLHLFRNAFLGPGVRPQILLAPSIAETIVGGGYSKERMKQYLYEHAVFSARRYEKLSPNTYDFGSICDAVAAGVLPAQYCQSKDPARMLPVVWSPEDFMITVSGGIGTDVCFICAQNGFIGYPVSKRIELPSNWHHGLLKEKK